MKKTLFDFQKQFSAISILPPTKQQQVKGGNDSIIIMEEIDGA